MRPTTLIGGFALVVMGIIGADILTHPTGTKDAGNAIVSIEKPAFNALLGTTS